MSNFLTNTEYWAGMDSIIRAFGDTQKIAWTEWMWKIRSRAGITEYQQKVTWLAMFAMRRWDEGHALNYLTDKEVAGLFSFIRQFIPMDCNTFPYKLQLTSCGEMRPCGCGDNDSTTTAGCTPPAPLEFIVGTTPGAPETGTEVWVHEYFADFKAHVIRNKIPLSYLPWNSDAYLTVRGDELTLNGGQFDDGDLLQVIFSCKEGSTTVPGNSSGFPVFITSDAFESDGISVVDSRFVGVDLVLYVDNVGINLYEGVGFERTTAGFRILTGEEATIQDFDARVNNYTIEVKQAH